MLILIRKMLAQDRRQIDSSQFARRPQSPRSKRRIIGPERVDQRPPRISPVNRGPADAQAAHGRFYSDGEAIDLAPDLIKRQPSDGGNRARRKIKRSGGGFKDALLAVLRGA